MIIDLKKSNRSTLTKDQKEFLERIIPWGVFLQEQTKIKASYFKGIDQSNGIYASIVLSFIIIESNWGTHPVSKDIYKSRPANNLCLLEADDYWEGRKLKLDDKLYRSFEDYEEFFIHYSDIIVFSKWYKDLIETKNFNEQILIFCMQTSQKPYYNEKIKAMIELYNLGEFDLTWD